MAQEDTPTRSEVSKQKVIRVQAHTPPKGEKKGSVCSGYSTSPREARLHGKQAKRKQAAGEEDAQGVSSSPGLLAHYRSFSRQPSPGR